MINIDPFLATCSLSIKKISLLFDVTNKDELEKKINESDISFIFPHQLDLFSKNFIDLVLAVDCLHEMDQKTIQNDQEKNSSKDQTKK